MVNTGRLWVLVTLVLAVASLQASARRLNQKRIKRSTSKRNVEIYVICDKECSYAFNYDVNQARNFLTDVVSRMNKYAGDVDMNVTEVGFEMWTRNDYIDYSEEETGDEGSGRHGVLAQLRTYRQSIVNKYTGSDLVLLISGRRLPGVNGAAVKASVCNTDTAVAFVTFQKSDPYKVAYTSQTALHEMGHALGMSHDTDGCACTQGIGQCIMAATQTAQQTVHPTYSECSIVTLATDISDGYLDCLFTDEPKIESACGNGVLDEGEECDCGTEECDCCDKLTCKFVEAGETCNTNDCMTCSGTSSQCEGTQLADFTSCDGGRGQCFDQSCRSTDLACQTYFGPSAETDREATEANKDWNSKEHNGGGMRLYDTSAFAWSKKYKQFVKDNSADGSCGQLQCRSENTARVLDSDGNFVRTYTYRLNWKKGTRIIYELFGDVHWGRYTYKQFFPILAPRGAPCKLENGQTGYCNSGQTRPDQWNWNQIRFSTCDPLPTK